MEAGTVAELVKIGGYTLVFLVGWLSTVAMFIKHLKDQNAKTEQQVTLLITALETNRSANSEHAQTNKELKQTIDSFNQQSAVVLSYLKGKSNA